MHLSTPLRSRKSGSSQRTKARLWKESAIKDEGCRGCKLNEIKGWSADILKFHHYLYYYILRITFLYVIPEDIPNCTLPPLRNQIIISFLAMRMLLGN